MPKRYTKGWRPVTAGELARKWHDLYEVLAAAGHDDFEPIPWDEAPERSREVLLAVSQQLIDWIGARDVAAQRKRRAKQRGVCEKCGRAGRRASRQKVDAELVGSDKQCRMTVSMNYLARQAVRMFSAAHDLSDHDGARYLLNTAKDLAPYRKIIRAAVGKSKPKRKDQAPRMHFDEGDGKPYCGWRRAKRLTTDPGRVTCGRCLSGTLGILGEDGRETDEPEETAS